MLNMEITGALNSYITPRIPEKHTMENFLFRFKNSLHWDFIILEENVFVNNCNNKIKLLFYFSIQSKRKLPFPIFAHVNISLRV